MSDPVESPCPDCGGTGLVPGVVVFCDRCGGTGQIVVRPAPPYFVYREKSEEF